MPLFSRPDGDLIKNLDPVRKMMPFVMRGRNECGATSNLSYFTLRP